VEANRRRRASRFGKAMGQGHGDSVRGRRRLWNGSFLRAGPALASLHGICRAADWCAVLPRGFAFFTEAIFLGVYLYGWDRISSRTHMIAGVLVALSGAAGTVFVIMVNAWMNTPVGFAMGHGTLARIDPLQAMRSPAAFPQALHTLAAYTSTGLAVAGIHRVASAITPSLVGVYVGAVSSSAVGRSSLLLVTQGVRSHLAAIIQRRVRRGVARALSSSCRRTRAGALRVPRGDLSRRRCTDGGLATRLPAARIRCRDRCVRGCDVRFGDRSWRGSVHGHPLGELSSGSAASTCYRRRRTGDARRA
jgi:Cytochrome bd terminal oxidase subunit I